MKVKERFFIFPKKLYLELGNFKLVRKDKFSFSEDYKKKTPQNKDTSSKFWHNLSFYVKYVLWKQNIKKYFEERGEKSV